MKSKDLAYGAGALTLILLSFLLFKAMTNLVNCITVPLIFLYFTQGFDIRSKSAVAMAVVLAVVLLFPAQIIFVLIDLAMAFLLFLIIRRKMILRLLYPVIMTCLLILGVVTTDRVFLTKINEFVLRISAGSTLLYIGIFLIEALIISCLHFLFYDKILRRTGQPKK